MEPIEEEKPLNIDSIKCKLCKVSATETPHSIFRVHEHLRNVNKEAYEPEIIAIGPYHRAKGSLEMMEKHKWRYLKLLSQHLPATQVDKCFSTIGELEPRSRNCYVIESHTLGKEEFVEMLVLDGCFIIELVRKFISRDSTCDDDPIFQMPWIMSSLQRDLILFENQIPFFVLCELFDLIDEGPSNHNTLIDRLLSFCSNLGPRSRNGEQSPLDQIEGPNNHNILIDRLLSFGSNLGPRSRNEEDRLLSSCSNLGPRSRNEEQSPLQNPTVENIKHLLHLVYESYVSSMKGEESRHLERESLFIPCAEKLKDANVKFEIKEKYDTLFAVEFKDGIMLFKEGKMRVPPLTIEDRTECFFRNLIAYEQYFPSDHGNVITDYVTFMDCLINSSTDVEILSEEGIIDNWLGDDKAVADVLNRLAISINSRGDKFYYAEMFKRINSHYKSPWNRWMAMLWGKVLYSPWTKISFAAATVLLALTIAQTVLSIVSVL